MVATLALLLAVAASVPCKTQGGLRIYLERDATSARDTIMSLRLCLMVPASGSSIRSLSGRIVVDTTFARVAKLVLPAGSPLLANADSAGAVLVAAASNRTIRGGTLLTIRTRLVRAGVWPRVGITLTELNDAGGHSAVTRATVSGLSPRCAGVQPAIYEVLPPEASADPGTPLELILNGCAFHPLRNTVRFGEVTVPNVPSTGDGTRIRIIVPKEVRSAAEVPPMQLGPGLYDVSVNNGRGSSNALRIRLR